MPANTILVLYAKAKILQQEGRVFPSRDFSAGDHDDEAACILSDIEAICTGVRPVAVDVRL